MCSLCQKAYCACASCDVTADELVLARADHDVVLAVAEVLRHKVPSISRGSLLQLPQQQLQFPAYGQGHQSDHLGIRDQVALAPMQIAFSSATEVSLTM